MKSDVWGRNNREAPLSQRAWAVQERISAPRTLYFVKISSSGSVESYMPARYSLRASLSAPSAISRKLAASTLHL